MIKFLIRHLMVNCREATFLMSKKEEGKLSLKEKFDLAMHTSMCSFCRRFEKQASKIGMESKGIIGDEKMSTISREKIEKMIKEN